MKQLRTRLPAGRRRNSHRAPRDSASSRPSPRLPPRPPSLAVTRTRACLARSARRIRTGGVGVARARAPSPLCPALGPCGGIAAPALPGLPPRREPTQTLLSPAWSWPRPGSQLRSPTALPCPLSFRPGPGSSIRAGRRLAPGTSLQQSGPTPTPPPPCCRSSRTAVKRHPGGPGGNCGQNGGAPLRARCRGPGRAEG